MYSSFLIGQRCMENSAYISNNIAYSFVNALRCKPSQKTEHSFGVFIDTDKIRVVLNGYK
jgi:hypothetical protein